MNVLNFFPKMEGSNPLLPQPPQSSPTTFGGTANALARLGRPIPGPFAHFASPIAPYTMPSFAAGLQQSTANSSPSSLFNDQSSLHSTLASMAAYSFDSFLSANFSNFANLLMMSPNQQNSSLNVGIPSPLLGTAFGSISNNGTTNHPSLTSHLHHQTQISPTQPSSSTANLSLHNHSPSPNSVSSNSSSNYYQRRDSLISSNTNSSGSIKESKQQQQKQHDDDNNSLSVMNSNHQKKVNHNDSISNHNHLHNDLIMSKTSKQENINNRKGTRRIAIYFDLLLNEFVS